MVKDDELWRLGEWVLEERGTPRVDDMERVVGEVDKAILKMMER